MPKPLTSWQQAVARVYGGGDYDFVAEPGYTDVDLRRDIAMHAFGDTLFNFLMLELAESEDCDSLDVAKERLDNAIAQLREARAALDTP